MTDTPHDPHVQHEPGTDPAPVDMMVAAAETPVVPAEADLIEAEPAPHVAAQPVEPPPEPPVAEPPPPPPPPIPPTQPHKPGTPLWLTALLAILVIIGFAWATQIHSSPDMAAPDPRIAQLTVLINQDEARIAALEAKLNDVASRPPASAARADTSALEARLAALEQRPAPAIPDIAGAVAGANADLSAKLASLDSKLQQDMEKEAARTALSSRLQAATVALQLGQKLGDLPGAPPALARYAQTAPPTEASLRQSFAGYAAAAEAASHPALTGQDFADRMLTRIQSLVTIRQGDKVLVGAPAAVALEAAHGKLDSGDLAGAVAALGKLDDAARIAMAPWLQDALALLDARAALVSMAAKS
jgi:hypothetical protein